LAKQSGPLEFEIGRILLNYLTQSKSKQITSLLVRLSDKRRGGCGTSIGQTPRRMRHINRLAGDTFMTTLQRFVKDDSGATAIEYGLIAAGISVAIITVVNTLGTQLKSTFTTISSQLATAGK
jgi:pilus assembly protein Flp/PilA